MLERTKGAERLVFADSDEETEEKGGDGAVTRSKRGSSRKNESAPGDSDKRRYFENAKLKGWRLVVRNLAFNTKKEDLQVLCSKFGPFTEIVLPPCKDPKYPNSCAGFAFVQFKTRDTAEAFMQSLNLSEVNGRKVAIDWAINKDTYETANYEEKEKEKKSKGVDAEKIESKEEAASDDDSESDDEQEQQESESDLSDSESSPNKASSSKRSSKRTDVERDLTTKPNEAIQEGRVVFVRNISYETTDEMLKDALQKFGTIELAVICRYADSDHSKGSGFVYFNSKQQADMCLEAITSDPGIVIDNRRIYAHRALPRDDAAAIEKEKLRKQPKDKRNLHLLRVGVIRSGTAAARGMSETDAKKRAKLALTAKEKLRNLHMFVSPVRLVVHNLPTSLSDKAFRSICFLAAGNADAKITECRIWRNNERLDGKGLGKSRGFGFVAFSEHKDALAALRNLNNNPETFTNEKRPIAEFSIENLAALKLRESRLVKSKEKLTKEVKNGDEISEKTRIDVEKTKSEMSIGGQKPLPSRMGPKNRHRNLKNDKKHMKIRRPEETTDKFQKVSKKRSAKIGGVEIAKKRSRLSRQKQLTKYLALH
ncbi:unnamed protein product [Anisakis simplex]|uniref:RNA-binding protein 28 (inferred by orthology to a human protein) n=1 Tax=Anisakis simplex TaxID=6269 RepID=A0A0M3JUE6_ANISI|nr:unnamed protein product [Anisakis simplex]